jgi:hypothetical protein
MARRFRKAIGFQMTKRLVTPTRAPSRNPALDQGSASLKV